MERRAECYHCGSTVISRPELKDFIARENKPTDLYYCGWCLTELDEEADYVKELENAIGEQAGSSSERPVHLVDMEAGWLGMGVRS